MVIYLDILMILNLFVDYFLLLSSSVFLKIDVKKRRLVLAALVGSLFSFLILLPSLGILVNLLIKICSGFILILIAFGFRGKQIFLKTVSIFFLENLVFIGVMFFVWVVVSPPGMFWKNGVTYIAISPAVLVVGSLVAYVITSIVSFMMSKIVDVKKIYSIEIMFNNRKIRLKALYDSGNCLVEPFSSKPVCVCEFEKLVDFLPEEIVKFFEDFFKNIREVENSNFKKVIKLVPCSTISGSVILPAFLPQSFFVLKDGFKKEFDCYVAVTNKKISDGEYCAIVGDFN